jgi:hypothetical protein
MWPGEMGGFFRTLADREKAVLAMRFECPRSPRMMF